MNEPGRLELLHLAEEALHRLAPGLPADAAVLLRRLHAEVPSAELAAPEGMAAAAASLFALAQDRPPGITRLRVLPPAPGQGAHAVAEIVTDDMPFLVDSVLGALARQGRVVRQLLHPVLAVRRDAAGALLALEEGPGSAPAGTAAESMMRITLGAAPATMLPGQPAAAADDWPALQAALAKALADTRIAVADFPAMAALLRAGRGRGGAARRAGGHRLPALAGGGELRPARASPPGADGGGRPRPGGCREPRPAARHGAAGLRRAARPRQPAAAAAGGPGRGRRGRPSPRPTCGARCTGRSMPMWW